MLGHVSQINTQRMSLYISETTTLLGQPQWAFHNYIFLYIYFAQLRLHQENTDMYSTAMPVNTI